MNGTSERRYDSPRAQSDGRRERGGERESDSQPARQTDRQTERRAHRLYAGRRRQDNSFHRTL